MNVFIINHPDQEELFTAAAEDMEERFGIEPKRWVMQPEGERQTLQYMMLEALVGEGPWLITWDSVRFMMDPHRIGAMGDIHLYGGWGGEDPLSTITDPIAFLIMNNDTRKMLADAWARKNLRPSTAWANVLAGSSLTWDAYPTVKELT